MILKLNYYSYVSKESDNLILKLNMVKVEAYFNCLIVSLLRTVAICYTDF